MGFWSEITGVFKCEISPASLTFKNLFLSYQKTHKNYQIIWRHPLGSGQELNMEVSLICDEGIGDNDDFLIMAVMAIF